MPTFALFGAFKQHVFNEVRHAFFSFQFIARASINGKSAIMNWHRIHLMNDAYAVG